MQKILMNYYEYDKERHIIMVDVYLLPANEGDCLWVRYGKKEGTRHNIIIDGGVESNGGDIASIIENIAERNEKVDIFVTHIDGDHIRGLIKGIGISNAEVMLNDYKHQKSEIVSDTSKFPLVSFALNINMQFDENYEVLIRKNTDINNKLSHLKNELEPLTEFKVLNINVLENELENITQTVAKMELTVSDFTIYKNYTENEFLEMGDKYNAEKVELGIRIELLCQISEENTARFYFTNYKQNKRAMWNAERRSEKLQIEKENKIVELDKIQKNLEKELSLYFSKSTMNEIYQKIDPHDVMKRLEYHLSFNDAQKGELFITLSESESDSDSDYRPEIYFSTAQLNTVAFSSFFSRALDRKNNLPIQTIFIDDPIGHFDDMNILGFADLMRSLIDNSNWQIVISTHDEKIFRILQRKLSGEYYSSCFLKLPSGKGIKWIE